MKALVLIPIGLLAATLAACGGGGSGSSSPGGSVIPTIAPSSTPTTSPTVSPSSSPTASANAATGTVVDYTSGTAIANATVVVGSTLILGATPPPTMPTGDVSTTTNASGAFSVNVPASGSGYIEIFTTDGHATLHSPATFSPGNAFGTLKIVMPTADDLSYLNAINASRATYAAQPVIFDSLLLEAARLWTTYEVSNGRNTDDDTLAPAPYATSITVYGSLVEAINNGSLGTFNVGIAQDRDAAANGAAAEAGFASEGPSGPHFSNIIAPSARWVGDGNDQAVYTLMVMPPPAGV